MKRLMSLLGLIAMMIMPVMAFAAGTVADSDGKSLTADDWEKVGNGIWKLDVAWTDDGTGISATIPVPASLHGAWIFKALSDPGATAPTAAFDVEIQWHGVDVFGGALHDLSATSNEDADYSIIAPMDADLLFVLSGNSTSGATGIVTVYIQK